MEAKTPTHPKTYPGPPWLKFALQYLAWPALARIRYPTCCLHLGFQFRLVLDFRLHLASFLSILSRGRWATVARLGFHCPVSKASWSKQPHAVIDNKRFPMYLTAKGRDHAARRSVRGAYRSGKEAVQGHLVKPKGGTCKFPAQGIMVAAGVIKDRIRMWHTIDGRWTGNKAAAMYGGPLLKALAKAYPTQAARRNCKWIVLEDNDPAGYKSSVAVRKKKEVNINIMKLPPRSPDLNVLDYSLWNAIDRRLRKQEEKFQAKKKETKDEFIKRLRRTALGLPAVVVKKAVQDMKRRCTLIRDAKAGHCGLTVSVECWPHCSMRG